MTFDKQVLFLGLVSNQLRDGGVYYTIQLFDQASGPVSVNVMDNQDNAELLDALQKSQFGTPLTVTFILRPKDKLYKLGISHVSF